MAGAFSASSMAAVAPVEKNIDKNKKSTRNGMEAGSKKNEKNPIVQAIPMGSNSNSSSSGGAELNLILFDEVFSSPK
jgi:hypothetical protein